MTAPDPFHLELYRWAVQDPETHVEVLRRMHERVTGGLHPTCLREDFAGTSAECVAWLAYDPAVRDPRLPPRTAVAVDLDGPTLAWARARATRLLGPRAGRIRFVTGDALEVRPPAVPGADLISVLNFSILYLREPDVLRAYLAAALEGLKPGGILVANLFGGHESTAPGTVTTRVTPRARLRQESVPAPYDFHWEVVRHDPADASIECRIHFTAAGREIRDAFTYGWRLWSPAELQTALTDVGFQRPQVWRHTYDASRGADGVFLGAVDPSVLEGEARWTAYVVAQRPAARR